MLDASFAVIKDEEQRSELAEFYSKHKERLFNIAYSRLHSREAAQDAVQEVFSRIADKPELFFGIPEEKRLAYADVTVKNISIDMFNSQSKMPVNELDETIEDTKNSPENRLIDKITRDEILLFINNLPILQKNVLMLHCLFGLSIDDTARTLNISLDAANKRLALARKAVKEFVDERRKNYE